VLRLYQTIGFSTLNILFVCPYTPTPIRTRPYNLIRALVRRGHSLTLATLWETEAEFHALAELESSGMRVISAPLTKRRVGINAAMALAAGLPLQSMYCWQPALARQIDARVLDARAPFDLVHVEHLRGAKYGLELKRRVTPPIQIVWDSVDCISYLFEQAAQNSQDLFGRWVTRFELGRTRRHESWLVRQFNQTLVTAEQDREAFAALECNAHPLTNQSVRITVLRNGVDLEYFAPTCAPRNSQTLVFSGKLSYHANVTAALYLLDEIMPRVWQAVPEARAQIVGYKPPRKLLQAQQKNPDRVSIIGSVPDLRPYLAAATVAVAPILYGTGIQNKVLEAMAMGTPVVATPKAVAALSATRDEDFLLGKDADAFARQIVRTLTDPGLAARIGQGGRRFVESQHDWARIAEQLESIYTEMISSDPKGFAQRGKSGN
jgi:glycosyltransferase involved in cell wall biosynthesis